MVDVVVVDDSQFMRVQIREILEKGGHDVVAEAGNGHEAVETVTEVKPDVVTMDVKMPGMDGIEAVGTLMTEQPTPVLMLSRYTEEGADTTLDALDAGAVDFMRKPDGEVTTSLVEYADDLVELVEIVADADVEQIKTDTLSTESGEETTAGLDTGGEEIPSTLDGPELSGQWTTPPTLVIAASTGGPSEIHTVLGALPATLGARVIIVQHMPEAFTDRFATRLDEISALDVSEATDGHRLGPNEAVVARGGSHLEIARDTGRELIIELTDDDPVHSVRPAADVTLESAAKTVDSPLVAVVLSGMGYDGAVGTEWIDDAGGTVITQSPETASISSMPERAIDTGAVSETYPTDEIPAAIVELLESAAK